MNECNLNIALLATHQSCLQLGHTSSGYLLYIFDLSAVLLKVLCQ